MGSKPGMGVLSGKGMWPEMGQPPELEQAPELKAKAAGLRVAGREVPGEAEEAAGAK
jgi:hypothetical protein